MFDQKADAAAVRENLTDAGCSEEFMERFLSIWEDGDSKEQLRLLRLQRSRLLDCVHAEQKKLDCLDYLCCQIQKQEKIKKEKSDHVREHLE